ncbi:hypothetical protein Ancab_010413 [Ancistrocladus abbreviatus]
MVLSLFFIIFLFPAQSSASNIIYSVTNYGAEPDGATDSSKAFSSAWAAACASATSSTLYVPAGTFLISSTVVFSGKTCKFSSITFRIDGTLLAPSDYRVLGSSGTWLSFESVNGVSISGGILDGQGSSLWACKASGKSCPAGVTTLGFSNSNNVAISGLMSKNSQLYHIVINGCNNVQVQGVKVTAPSTSPNTDGIHVEQSSIVSISNTQISTGDDCVSVGPGTSGLWIENVACGPGHGISIGSLGKAQNEQGVQNVTVKTVTFTGSQNGVRIKSWARPSTSFVQNVLFQHATMVNVQNPIIIDQNYCPDNNGCSHQASGVRISDVTYQDIHGSSATEVAVNFDCSSKYPCSNVVLEDVNLSYKKQGARSTCANADGSTSGVVEPSSCLK